MGNFTTGVVVIPSGGGGVPQQVAGSSGAGGMLVLRCKKANAGAMVIGPSGPGAATLTGLNGMEIDASDGPVVFPAVQGEALFVIGAVGDALTWALIDP